MARKVPIHQRCVVLSALRGPDHDVVGADDWKRIVVCPLRYAVARSLGRNPTHWTWGSVCTKAEAKGDWEQEFCARQRANAQRFARSEAANHVVYHADVAWSDVDQLYREWLQDIGLLRVIP